MLLQPLSLLVFLLNCGPGLDVKFTETINSHQKGIKLPKQENLEDQQLYQTIRRELINDPLMVLANIGVHDTFPTFEEFSSIFPQLKQEDNPQQIYEAQKQAFDILKNKRKLPTREIEVQLINHMGECETKSCPFNRIKTDKRTKIIELMREHLTETEINTLTKNQTKPLVLTAFAAGTLFQDLLIMTMLSTLPVLQNTAMEINIIEPSLQKFTKDEDILNLRDGAALLQFNRFMHYLFPNSNVYLYFSALDYIKEVEDRLRLPSDVTWAVDFGVEGFEFVTCMSHLQMLSIAASNPYHWLFSFPYHIEQSTIILKNKALDSSSKELAMKLFNTQFGIKNTVFDADYSQTDKKLEQDLAEQIIATVAIKKSGFFN